MTPLVARFRPLWTSRRDIGVLRMVLVVLGDIRARRRLMMGSHRVHAYVPCRVNPAGSVIVQNRMREGRIRRDVVANSDPPLSV